MDIIYILLILSLNSIEGQFMKNEKEFDLLVNISQLHFYSNRETCVIVSKESRHKYFDQLCKKLGENWPLVIKEKNLLNEEDGISGKNILIFEMDTLVIHYNTQYNKYLYYIDLRENYSTCAWKQYLNNVDKDDIWDSSFQSIFLFHYQKNCSNEYEIWLREPWSKNPGRKIENIKDAYFNKKPNMHGTEVSFLTTMYERARKELPEDISLQLFKKIWFEKWNMVYNRNSWRFSTIFVEPTNGPSNSGAYRIMSMCFVVQKGKEHPKWEVIIWCFHWKVWVSLTAIWFISGLAWFFIQKHTSLLQSLSEVYSLLVTEPISWLPKLNSNLSLLSAGLLMLMSIVIITGFQSNLYKNMQIPMLYPPINEIKQIKELNHSIICTYPYSCNMIFGKTLENYATDQLLKKMVDQVTPDSFRFGKKSNYTLYDVFNNPKMALITSCESAELMINSIPMFSKKLHVVEEVIASFPLCYEGFPFEKQMHQLLLSYFESGIGQWEEHMYQIMKLMRILRNEKKEPLVRIFNMDDVQVAFIILFIGLCISTFVFFLELMFKHWHFV